LADVVLVALAVVVVTAVFAFTNGFQDSASSVATMIAAGAATPRQGVLFSALFNFIGAVLGGSAVAFTVQGLVSVNVGIELAAVLLAAVVSATAWNLVTWWFGLPSSSTHALVGGLVGAGIAAAGAGSVSWGLAELANGQLTGISKVVALLLLSVLAGFLGGYLVKKLSLGLLRNAKRGINGPIRKSQFLTVAALAFAHGANDSQKQMGVMTMALLSAGLVATASIPVEVRLLCALMVGLGTIGGGWKIMKTLGRKIYRIKPVDSLGSQIASVATIVGSTLAGAPVSSNQVVSSSVMGVGAAENARLVQWSVGKQMVVSWFITIPAAALLSSLIFIMLEVLIGG